MCAMSIGWWCRRQMMFNIRIFAFHLQSQFFFSSLPSAHSLFLSVRMVLYAQKIMCKNHNVNEFENISWCFMAISLPPERYYCRRHHLQMFQIPNYTTFYSVWFCCRPTVGSISYKIIIIIMIIFVLQLCISHVRFTLNGIWNFSKKINIK